jgi:hypothetical protein
VKPIQKVKFYCSLFLLLTMGISDALAKATTSNTEKFHGEILSSDIPPGYSKMGGECLPTDLGEASECDLSLEGGEFIASSGEKILVTWLLSKTNIDKVGGTILWRIEDSIEHSPSYRGTFYPEFCRSDNYPMAKILARGEWNHRKPPQIGGYLRPIEKA